eukprot:CAMPEP_0113260968 /NCGR_PEP_ID=MMETSP0008_2-20120614/17157_1 /TAXON_ID=97485 /ORGANISM="Prymnesium parvum" /LENGTH=77 /DNA_ID=CAMNT_0000109567 /DNA_START=1242 /DNA_END=1472 /DNA_ORIENTATION=+ /assembly_acc=CAM_ASM_000153
MSMRGRFPWEWDAGHAAPRTAVAIASRGVLQRALQPSSRPEAVTIRLRTGACLDPRQVAIVRARACERRSPRPPLTV